MNLLPQTQRHRIIKGNGIPRHGCVQGIDPTLDNIEPLLDAAQFEAEIREESADDRLLNLAAAICDLAIGVPYCLEDGCKGQATKHLGRRRREIGLEMP